MYFKYLLCCCSKQQEHSEAPPVAEAACARGAKSAEHSHLNLLDQGNSGVQVSASVEDASINTANIVMQERSSDSLLPRLEIRVIDGTALPFGHLFKISNTGLEGSIRGVNDGEVYFGGVAKVKEVTVNDYVLPSEDGVGSRHFMIKFNPVERKFAIKDLGEGTGTFVKVTTRLLLREHYILSFGENHMLVTPCEILPGRDEGKISLKFIDGPKTDKEFSFLPQDSPIRVGRQADCQLRFEDNSLSRYQCLLTYDAGGWYLQDGDGKKNSTNGTWLFVDFLFEIYDHMIFKAGQTLFEATLL